MKKYCTTIAATGKDASALFQALTVKFQSKSEQKMSKRIKPSLPVPIVATLEDADATLAAIAARKRELALLELGLKEDVDRLKLECAEKCDPINQDIKLLGLALQHFAESRKEELFSKKKSHHLTFGKLGFQASSTLKTVKRAITWERVLGTLEDLGMDECIRVKKEVDKDALRKLAPEALARVGCKLLQDDSFYYELAEAEVAGATSAS